MDQVIRNQLQRATQDARRLLEAEFAEQLEGTYDILPDGTIHDEPGAHLDDRQRLTRQKLVDAIQHRITGGKSSAAAVDDYTREAAFTFLNRFVALRMLEARGLVQQCVTKGELSSGFKEFSGLAPGLAELPDKGYRLYLECLFDELSIEVKVLFDRHDAASLLWPRRQALTDLLTILNQTGLESVWDQDETIGWVYQYFNSSEERKKMREKSAAPRNSHELAVRNQFFTPRYVVEFLTDNTLGRIWYEMRQGNTSLKERCRYLVRRPDEVFLGHMTFSGEDGYEDSKTIAEAKHLLEGTEETFPPFSERDTQRLICFAHCVNAYMRHPLGDEQAGDNWDPWAKKREFEVAESLTAFSTQDLLDVMFYQCRADRHSFAPGIEEPVFLRIANEIRRRALHSRSHELSQAELLKQPFFVPFRAKKDPRDLKILDPACGSGHFLLYCVDLLLTIYEEAWHDEESPPAKDVPGPDGQSPAKALREDYATIESLREAVPDLILLHNLHGIDIDPRCAQIAAFVLWMRAQRAFSEFGFNRASRPTLRKTNIVVAEPMPGEKDLLKEFTTASQPPLLGQLLEVVFNEMLLAGETGSLLKIEEELRDTISKARKQWTCGPKAEQLKLFAYDQSIPQQLQFDLSGITDDVFWLEAESRAIVALRDFAEVRSRGSAFRRTLFADDAARGFAFVDLCRKCYDVVLMNPPFGLGLKTTEKYLQSRYAGSGREEVAASFYTRALDLVGPGGRIGEISSRTCFFLPTLANWRESVVFDQSTLEAFADLGENVLDGAVNETAAYVAKKGRVAHFPCVFGMFHRTDTLEDSLLDLSKIAPRPELVIRPLSDFEVLPDRPLCYWTSNAFVRALPRLRPLGDSAAEAQMGLAPRDEFRFSRLWWEVDPRGIGRGRTWVGYAKGGELSPYYSDVELLLKGANELAEIKAALNQKYPYLKGNLSWVLHPENDYFAPGLTFGQRTTFLRMSVLPADSYFSVAGKAVFGCDQSTDSLLQSINTPAAQFLVSLRREFLAINPQFQEGDVARMPWPDIERETLRNFEAWAMESTLIVRSVASFDETDHAFRCVSLEGTARRTTDLAAETVSQNEARANDLLFSESAAQGLLQPLVRIDFGH